MLLRMDNETRQFSARGASSDASKSESQVSQSGSTSNSDSQRAQRPKQYIPDPGSPMEQTSLGQPVYDPPQYDPQYGPFYESEGRQGSNIAAMVLGVLLAIAIVSALVLYFLWRSAAAEAEKPPVTVTQTQTETTTTTATTTKRPSIFGNRDSDSESAPQAPVEPTPQTQPRVPAPTLELPPELQDIVDGILEEEEVEQ